MDWTGRYFYCVVTKWIGLEGTSIAAKEKETLLLESFAPSFVETAKKFDQYLSVIPEAKIASEWGVSAMHDITEGGVFGALWEMGSGSGVGLDIDLKAIPIRQETVEVCEWGVSAMHDITEGGVFGALWEMGSGSGVGLDIDLKAIPIRQETVEVCEVLGLNPYILMSSGSMMIAAKDGYGLVRKLKQAGIEAAVVGKATDGNDRILRNGEDTRYLDKPQSDELYKIYQ